MQNIPLFSAEKANNRIDLYTPVKAVLDSHWYILGSQVKLFEEEFANYVGTKHCISVANGSDAIELALRGLGIKPGERVVTVANAGFYSSTAIYAVGALPEYVDIDPISMTLCPNALNKLIDSKPAAIIVTHLYGQLANIEKITQIAHAAGIPVVEDCAQSHGARRNGKHAGSFGTIASFSFYPTKNLGALGDGGAVVTNNNELAARIRKLRQYGWSEKYSVNLPGGRNSRLDEIQAAILRIKLTHLDSWNEERRDIARRYNEAFVNFEMQLPCSTNDDYVAHLYVVRVKNRSEFSAFLKGKMITTDIHYPIADHNQVAYSPECSSLLNNTEQACETVISLPCFPGLSNNEIEQVIESVATYFLREI